MNELVDLVKHYSNTLATSFVVFWHEVIEVFMDALKAFVDNDDDDIPPGSIGV